MRRTKRAVSLIITIMMVISMLPSQAFAEETFTVGEIIDEGTSIEEGTSTEGETSEEETPTDEGIFTEGEEILEETPIAIGTVVVRYEDEYGIELLSEDTYGELDLGEHTFSAPKVEGYIASLNSETINLEFDSQIRYIVFTYTEIEETRATLKLTLADCSDCIDSDEFTERIDNETLNVMEEFDYELVEGEVVIDVPSIYNELEMSFTSFNNMSKNGIIRETVKNEQGKVIGYKLTVPEITKSLHIGIVIGYVLPKPKQEAKLTVIFADCNDLNYKDEEDLEEFGERNRNDGHNVMQQIRFNLVEGENIINIPLDYNELRWTLTGYENWDSDFTYEHTDDELGNKNGIDLTAPYLTDLTLYVGYTLPEVEEEPTIEEPIIEEPEQEVSRPSGGGISTPKVEEEPISIKDIPQENFVARYVGYKAINEKFVKSVESRLSFEIDKTLLDELSKDGLTPRIYRWSEEKGKLIAEDTEFTIKEGTDNIYTLTTGTNRVTGSYLYGKENYYTLIAVKQPNFVDVKERDFYIDKANALGIIEGVGRDGIRYFEGDKSISRSEFYTMIARIFGAVPEGETKIYDLLDLKTMEEADEILKGLELGVADWSKPYVAALYEKGYITEFDIKEADNSTWNNLNNNLKIFEKLLSDVEDVKNNRTVTLMLENFKYGEDTYGFPTLQYNKRYNTIYALINILVEYGW